MVKQSLYTPHINSIRCDTKTKLCSNKTFQRNSRIAAFNFLFLSFLCRESVMMLSNQISYLFPTRQAQIQPVYNEKQYISLIYGVKILNC